MKEDTQKGLDAHIDQIASVISNAESGAEKLGGAISAIGIGSPGRFDMNGNIKSGTNPNLGNSLDEFDGINLQEQYQAAIVNKDIPLCINNDGSAMLAGIVEGVTKGHAKALKSHKGESVGKYSLPRQHVGLFGIGTGVGHAIASVKDNGSFEIVTDGHASKLRVRVDEGDLNTLREAKDRMEQGKDKQEVVMFIDNTVRAEDLFRGPVINALASVDNGREIDLNIPDHEAALKFAGKYMARTIALIKSGESEDVEPANGWTNEEKQEAAKTSHYFIGGGMGSSSLGQHIIEYAAKELNSLGIDDIQLIQATESSAARAAAALIPESLYRDTSGIMR